MLNRQSWTRLSPDALQIQYATYSPFLQANTVTQPIFILNMGVHVITRSLHSSYYLKKQGMGEVGVELFLL